MIVFVNSAFSSWTETYDAGTGAWANTFNPLETAELTKPILTDGKWGVILKLAGGETPPTPGEDDISVCTGEEKSITDLSKRVHLLGGTLDVTGLPQDCLLYTSPDNERQIAIWDFSWLQAHSAEAQ